METDKITEEEVQKAVDYLRDSSTECAKARAELIYVTEYRKSLKAILMKKHGELAYSGQEREAYADEEYKEHLDAIKEATFTYERLKFLRESAKAKIDAWQTMSANIRAIKV